jgi:glyoxylase-like metal-dependent hydrolase (beta-lactamase superfamily II)
MRILSRLVFAFVFTAVLVHAQQPGNRGGQNAPAEGAAQPQPANANSGDVHLLHVRGNVSMIVGAGGNITVQAGDQGIVLVDTGLPSATDKVAATIRPLSPKPVAYIINTDDAPDHIGGNLVFGTPPARRGAMVNIISYLTVLDRISAPVGGKAPPANAGWPNDTYSEAQRNLHFNGEAIEIFHQTGNTDGNSIVVFRGSDVVSTGDIFDPTQYPIIDLKKGGSIQGELEALNRLKASIIIP